jgi:Tfp pilus assembly protein PilF
MVYAQFLFRKGRGEEAADQLATAEARAGDNALTHFNIGLVYLEGKDYNRARVQAKRALELGFERPTLKDQLVALGKWDSPSAAEAAPPAAAASR